LAVGACSDSEPSADASTTTSSSIATTATTAPGADWAPIDDGIAALAPHIGFLAARVGDDGTCEPIHAIEPSTARPTGSQFKLFILGALAHQVVDGRLSWDQQITVDDAIRSLGNGEGSLQFVPSGASVSLQEAATKMISISDNTAADLLAGLAGRDAVEAQMEQWVADPSANEPFLTTRQMFLLHYVAGLGDQYLATPPADRAAFLASSVDPHALADIASGYSNDPRYIEQIEWFASPDDICTAFAGLQQLGDDPALSPTLSDVLSVEDAGIDLDPAEWPTVWYKGGSESGVLTLGWLATRSDGDTYVVQAMIANPAAPLAADSITDLRDLARSAFDLLE
jgi:hypothetical protein